MGMNEIPFCILEIKGGGATVSGTLVYFVGAPAVAATLAQLSVKDDQVSATIETSGQKSRSPASASAITSKGRRALPAKRTKPPGSARRPRRTRST